MELLRERAQALGHQLEGRDSHRELAPTRAHHGAEDSQPVSHIQVLQLFEGLFAERIDAAEQLDGARGIHELQESHLTLDAPCHDAASDSHLIFGVLTVFQMSVLLIQLRHGMGGGEGMAVRIASGIDERLTLGATHLDGIIFDDGDGLFSHVLSSSFSSLGCCGCS